jgi:transcriptional regulator with XRE-family HTH domain
MHPLARLRFERGLSRPALARAAGVSERTIFRVEHGQALPHGATIGALAAALGCQFSDLSQNDHDPAGEPGRGRKGARAAHVRGYTS